MKFNHFKLQHMPAAWREDSFLFELDIHIKTNAFTLVSCIACISSSQYVPNLYLFCFRAKKYIILTT